MDGTRLQETPKNQYGHQKPEVTNTCEIPECNTKTGFSLLACGCTTHEGEVTDELKTSGGFQVANPKL